MKSQEEQWLLSEKYGGEKSEAFFADCKSLALGTPLGYLIGHVPFLDCTIHLDGRPLIPRTETEFWVERAIEEITMSQATNPSLFAGGGHRPTTHILDLCAGSGCIGVAVAHAVPQTSVDFCEIDARLLPTIEKNCQVNNLAPERYQIYHANLFGQTPSTRQDRVLGRYDFILSNPPYIDPAVDRTTDSVKTHEPHLALYGGAGGMEVIEQIIAAAQPHMAPGGQLWIEHEPEQSNAISVLADKYNFACTTHVDQYDVQRYSILVADLNFKESQARL